MHEPPIQPRSKTSFKRNRRRARSRALRVARAAPFRGQRVCVEHNGRVYSATVLNIQHGAIRVRVVHSDWAHSRWYHLHHEGRTWVRGHTGEIADAFRARVALTRAPGGLPPGWDQHVYSAQLVLGGGTP